ncbi:MAG: relaxase/mobilization nuclease domain-containing protein, partial [Rhizobiales bacterium]|nr:relaxase/mobilization nuclease domain-containing protein [Hyphomicrobiales bacterium]
MIPNYTRGANYFGRLGRYLATGSVSDDTKSTERVAWMAYREIDPDMHWRVADEVMAATARTAVKQSCAEPTLHFMWSANPDDRYITRNEWEEIADKTLDRMGLVGHQAKIVEHNDTSYEDKPRQHIHIMANAVREDGLSWRIQSKKNPKNWGSGDYKWKSKLDELAREFERDYGLIELDTPLKAYREGREWEQARSKNRAEQEIDSRTGRTPDFPMTKVQIKEIAPHAKSIISSSKSWDEIQKSLYSEIGFSLKAKGPGLILRKEDGSYAKLSSLGKAKLSDQDKAQRLTKEHIGQAVGESWEDYWQRSEHKLDATKSKLMAGTYLSSSQFTDASQTSDEPS